MLQPDATTKKKTAIDRRLADRAAGQPRDDDDQQRERAVDEQRVAVRILRRRHLGHAAPLQLLGSFELPHLGLDGGEQRAVPDRRRDRLDVPAERPVVAQALGERADVVVRRARAARPARAARGTRPPGRPPAARSRARARQFATPATPSARLRCPSTRDPPVRRSSGSSRPTPDDRATCSRRRATQPRTAAIMNPELSPPSVVRNAGSPSLRFGLTRRSTRRSEMLASSATAIASASSANASGWPWKLPAETSIPSSTSTSGLSVAAFSSVPTVYST